MFRLLLMFLSGLTATSATVILTNWLGNADGLEFWLLAKVAAVITLLSVSIYTAWYFRRDVTKIRIEARLIFGGLILVGLGAAAVAFSLHLGSPSRPPEWWGLVLAGTTMAQGSLTVWHLWRCALRREERHIVYEV